MKHHIVAIGISKHKNSVANLGYAEKDATEFFTLFKQNIGDIGYNRLLVDQEATLSEIKTALGAELLRNVQQGDAFFFFYSGHGALVPDPKDPNTALSFLVPYDATHDIANTCLSVDDVKLILESVPSSANLVFIDSCFSGAVSKQGKSYPVPNAKSFSSLKSFTNTVVGNGSVVFTASKDDELSLEDPDYRNGLFTHHLLIELQKQRPGDTYSAMEIFSPIVSGVTGRAKDKWHHTQTPTFSGKLEGDLVLPVFKKRLHLKVDTVEIPKTPELSSASFSVPVMDISAGERATLLQDTIDFVVNTSSESSGKIAEVKFERFCYQLVKKIKADWEKIFEDVGPNVEKIPEAVSKLEASSYQLMILGAATATYGNGQQMRVFTQYLTSLFDLMKDRAGLVALIAAPEVIVAEAIYVVAVISVARNNYAALGTMLETTYENPRHGGNQAPIELIQNSHIYYTSALTGYSTKVNEHIREYLNAQDWLTEFAPKLDGKIDDHQLQANFLLVMLSMHVGQFLWPEFARFYSQRIQSLINKLLFDPTTVEQLAAIMGIAAEEVRPKFREYLTRIKKQGLDKYWWESIDVTDLMTEQEKTALDSKSQ